MFLLTWMKWSKRNKCLFWWWHAWDLFSVADSVITRVSKPRDCYVRKKGPVHGVIRSRTFWRRRRTFWRNLKQKCYGSVGQAATLPCKKFTVQILWNWNLWYWIIVEEIIYFDVQFHCVRNANVVVFFFVISQIFSISVVEIEIIFRSPSKPISPESLFQLKKCFKSFKSFKDQVCNESMYSGITILCDMSMTKQ